MNQKQLNKEDWGKVERKRGFFRSYARDFGKVTAGNAIMLGANMIIFPIALCVVMLLFPMIFPVFLPDELKEYIINTGLVDKALVTDEEVNQIYYLMCMLAGFLLNGMLLVANGPFCSAISYYFKNVIIGENDLKKDLKKGLKDNWKKSLGASAISVLVTCVLLFNIGYYQNGPFSDGAMGMAAKSFFFCILWFWSSMQLFIYPLIACVELSFKEVYRNAAVMVIKNFPIALLVFVTQAVLFGFVPFMLVFTVGSLGYGITILLYLLFSFGFVGYVSMYITWRAIQKILHEND